MIVAKTDLQKKNKADAHIVAIDMYLGGFPEDLSLLRYVGTGIHAPKEAGRALHYCGKHWDAKHKRCALYHVEGTDEYEGDEDIELVEEIPEDWWDE